MTQITIPIRNWSSVQSQESGGGISVAPLGVDIHAEMVDPVVVLGTITIVPLGVQIHAEMVDPQVIGGGISIAPLGVQVHTEMVDPTVVLGTVSIAPQDVMVHAEMVDPTVITTAVISPLGVEVVAEMVDPTVVLGSVTVGPLGAQAHAEMVDPTVVYGTVTIAPLDVQVHAEMVDPTVSLSFGVISPVGVQIHAEMVDPTVVYGSVTIAPFDVAIHAEMVDPFVVGGARAPFATFHFPARGRRGQRIEAIGHGIIKHPDESWDVAFNLQPALKSRGLKLLSVDNIDDGIDNEMVSVVSAVIIDEYSFMVSVQGGEPDHEYIITATMSTDPFATLVACGRIIVEVCEPSPQFPTGGVFFIGVANYVFRFQFLDGVTDDPVDISTATTKQVAFVSPSGVKAVLPAAFTNDGTDGRIQYTCTSTDFLEAGEWQKQAYYQTPTDEGYSTISTFEMVAPL